MERPAIIIIDMLNDFVTGALEVKRAKSVIAPLQKLVTAARLNDVPVIYSNDAHYPQDVEVTRKWGNHAIKGTPGAQVIPLNWNLTKKTTLWRSGLTAAFSRQAYTHFCGVSTRVKA